MLVSGAPSAADVAALTAHRSRFATVRVVVFEPAGAVGAVGGYGSGVEVVRVAPGSSFAAAWDRVGRRAPTPVLP